LPGLGGTRSRLWHGKDVGQAAMLLSTETCSGLGSGIWGGFFAREGLARQRPLHHTSEKLGSALTSVLCYFTQEQPKTGPFIQYSPVHLSVAG